MNPADPREGEGLTFPWNHSPASWWRLLPGLFICAAVLALMALVFKVAAPRPANGPAGTTSRAILLVNPHHPAAQGLLYRALDRGALLLGDPGLASESTEASLMPVFKPSFAGFEPRLKDPVSAPTSAPRQRLFSPEDLALPPLQAVPNHAAPPVVKASVLVPVWQGALAELTVRSSPSLSHVRPLDLSRLRFQVGVASNGRVVVVAPLTAGLEDRDWVPALQSALSQTRFSASDQPGLRWGEVTFVWKPATAPTSSGP